MNVRAGEQGGLEDWRTGFGGNDLKIPAFVDGVMDWAIRKWNQRMDMRTSV